MSSLLEAANASSGKDMLFMGMLPVEPAKSPVTYKLPERVGEVSIMPLKTLEDIIGTEEDDDNCYNDPTSGYNKSTYYVYGICDSRGKSGSVTGSTHDNLKAIGKRWYKQLNKPTTYDQTWDQAGHKLFGGPLYCTNSLFGKIHFNFWYDIGCYNGSSSYWGNSVDESVYVSVVRAK